ncbi:DUF7671 family protein [Lentilactobacillus kribbianus]|uniref:DUF7671 family protein n=1 Tax=Lentilactobacillus kribbianus TaxID=2729622 RepID=UPI001551CD12|nr:hypothetical protein [Lentilactobacillus kribbianus]
MKDKYEVTEYIGVPLSLDNSGHYQIKLDDNGQFRLHSWRTGKHTKGKFKQLGQVFITENDMSVVVIKTRPVPFKKRHAYTPLQRFTNEMVSAAVLEQAMTQISQ